MNQPQASAGPRILVAPLDWGLGHATRCIPIIKALIAANCSVFLAGEGKTRSLLEKEFPQLAFLPLKGYDIRYSAGKWAMPITIGLQIPKVITAIKKERRWLAEMQQKYRFHAVISDNRYGLHHKDVFNVFITHQLRIKTPFGGFSESILQALNFRFINRFSECWIPDHRAPSGLAGELSHPPKLPSVPVRYLGPLSRFARSCETTADQVVILLSGPEPQRTIFEDLILSQLNEVESPVALVRGLPGSTTFLDPQPNLTVYDHLPASQLEDLLSRAELVIGRCGYSTIMDLFILKKNGILVPTPGQTEQEYLASHLMKLNLAFCTPQKKFRLGRAIQLAKQFRYAGWEETDGSALSETVQNFLRKIAQKQEANT